MRPLFCFIVALLVAPLAAQAQAGTPDMNGPAAQANLRSLATGAPAVVPTGSRDVVGSPYADPRWLLARLELSNARPLAPVPLKYDVLGHRLLMRAVPPGPDSLQLDDRLVVGFVLEVPATGGAPAQQRRFRRFREAPFLTQRDDYVEVLHHGRYTLLKHYGKKLRLADYQNPYSTGSRSDEIENHHVYYLVTPAAALVPVKLSLAGWGAAAPELAAALPKKARLKTEAEWTAAFDAVDPAPAVK